MHSLLAQCHITSSGNTPTPDLFVVLVFKVNCPLGQTTLFDTDSVFVDDLSCPSMSDITISIDWCHIPVARIVEQTNPVFNVFVGHGL
jgi:hypothetical protein